MGVSIPQLQRYISEKSAAPFEVVARLCLRAGRSMEWLATGMEQTEDPRPVDPSQDLSEPHLTIAVEIANDIIRTEGVRYVPNGLYARLLKLMYEGVSQGLPVAEVYEFGREIAAAANSGATGERNDVGKQGLGGAGQGGRR